ncbi:MaoC family dehydratase [Actinosynnema sp. NPDC023587]|uniref:MaoC family dehydratase n=1 Tax=Actinosynnema sp. NPDC023587 TaxID=3154695 RepID=UPI0033E00E62
MTGIPVRESAAPQGFRDVEGGRYREVVGLGFDDLHEGMVVEHRPGRTITEYDNVLLCALTGNVAPIHTDAEFAGRSPHRRPLVCGTITLGIAVGMTTRTFSGMTVANLSLDNARFSAPVFAGDTLYAVSTVTGVRRSKSKPHLGIVSLRTSGFVAEREALSFERTFVVPTDTDALRDLFAY